jgi:hypothetical protein
VTSVAPTIVGAALIAPNATALYGFSAPLEGDHPIRPVTAHATTAMMNGDRECTDDSDYGQRQGVVRKVA